MGSGPLIRVRPMKTRRWFGCYQLSFQLRNASLNYYWWRTLQAENNSETNTFYEFISKLKYYLWTKGDTLEVKSDVKFGAKRESKTWNVKFINLYLYVQAFIGNLRATMNISRDLSSGRNSCCSFTSEWVGVNTALRRSTLSSLYVRIKMGSTFLPVTK